MSLPRLDFEVWLAGEEKPLEVTAINPDLIRYEREARKYGHPVDGRESPVIWQTFLAWAALIREGRYAQEWIRFRDTDCVGCEFADQSDEVPTVDPTPPAPESDSS